MALPSFFYGVRQENFPTEGIPLAQIRNDGMYWNQVILDQEAVLLRPGQEPEPTPHCPDLPGALPFSSESAD